MADDINLAALWVPILPELSKFNEAMRAAGTTGRRHLEEGLGGGGDIGASIGAQIGQGLLSGFYKTDAVGKFEGLFGGLNLKTLGIASAVAGVALGFEKLAAGMVHVGEEFEGIERQVTLFSAHSGDSLKELKEHADNLVQTLDTGTSHLGTDMGTLAARLNADASPALDTLTRHVEELRDRFGALDVDKLSGSFREFGITGVGAADNALASLAQSAMAVGEPLGTVITDLAKAGPVASDLNLTIEQTGALLTRLHERSEDAGAGVDLLQRAMSKAKGSNQDLPQFLQKEIDQIKAYEAAGNHAAADLEATDVFGARKAREAIDAGEEYLRVVKEGPDAHKVDKKTIDDTVAATRDLKNEWTEVTNRLKHDVEPAANAVLDATVQIAHAMDWIMNQRFGFATPAYNPSAGVPMAPSTSVPFVPGSPAPPGTSSPLFPGAKPIPGTGGGLGSLFPGIPAPGDTTLGPAGIGGAAAGGPKGGGGGLSDYIIQQGEQLGLTPTEIGMALAVQQHEGLGPNGLPSMGFGPEAKSAGLNFDTNPQGAVDQYFKQYTGRLPAGLDRNNPAAVASYIHHTVHNAADPAYESGLMGSYKGPASSGGGTTIGPGTGGGASDGGSTSVTGAVTSVGAPGSYGLPVGTDIRQGMGGFPPWVYALGNQFGMQASTYPGHQEGSGQNRGIDWFPTGSAPDMSGKSYSPEQVGRMEAFAKFLQTVPGIGAGNTGPVGGVEGMEIFQNPMTGEQIGSYGGAPDTSGSIYSDARSAPGQGYGGHQGHVHMTTSFPISGSPGGVSSDDLGSIPAQLTSGGGGGGRVGGGPGGTAGSGGSPYVPGTGETEAQARARQRGVEDAQDRVDSSKDSVERANDAVRSTSDAVNKAEADMKVIRDTGGKPGNQVYDDEMKEVTKAHRDYATALREQTTALREQKRSGEDLTEAQTRQQESGSKAPPSSGGRGGAYGAAEQLGSGLLRGIGESLGFPDIFGGKPPWEFGSVKLGLGALGWGLGFANKHGMLGGGGGGPGGGGSPAGIAGLPGGLGSSLGIPGLGKLGGPLQGGAPGTPGPPGGDPNAPDAGGSFAHTPGATGLVSSFTHIDNSMTVNGVPHGETVAALKGLQNSHQRSQAMTATPGAVPA